MRRKIKVNDNCWRCIGEFLSYSDILRIQLVNKYFYTNIVPTMTYWNRMFPRINNELSYFRGHDFQWYSLEIGGSFNLRQNSCHRSELIFDNNRQPQPLFTCSFTYEGPNIIKLQGFNFIFKSSMIYLGDYTYMVLPT